MSESTEHESDPQALLLRLCEQAAAVPPEPPVSLRHSYLVTPAGQLVPPGCPRCFGTGRLHQYRHRAAGLCFRCGGSGLR
jgi:hypothetical protein